MAKVETLQLPTVERKINFEGILDTLAEHMRQYDDLVSQKGPLLDSKEMMDAQFDDLDLELGAETYPEHIARNALEKIILDRRVDELDKQIRPLRGSFLN